MNPRTLLIVAKATAIMFDGIAEEDAAHDAEVEANGITDRAETLLDILEEHLHNIDCAAVATMIRGLIALASAGLHVPTPTTPPEGTL